MAKGNTRVSIRAYARHLQISDKTVRNAIRDGLLKISLEYFIRNKAGHEIMVPRIDIEIADKEWGCLHQTGKVKPGQNRLKKLDLGNGSANIKSTEISTHNAGANHQKVGNCVLSPHSGTHSNNDHNTVEFLLSLAIRPDMPPKEITRYRELISLAIDKLQLQILHNILSGAKQIN